MAASADRIETQRSALLTCLFEGLLVVPNYEALTNRLVQKRRQRLRYVEPEPGVSDDPMASREYVSFVNVVASEAGVIPSPRCSFSSIVASIARIAFSLGVS